MGKDLIFFGIQGCGKGTQANKLIEKEQNKYSYFSTGDVFRALMSSSNAIGNYLKNKINNGELISDEITIQVFQTYYMTLKESGKNMLLDGYPRSKKQIDNLISIAKQDNRELMGVYFQVPEEEVKQRMMLRAREDDNEQAIKKRIKQYYEKTKPIIDYFAENGDMKVINANQPIDEVFEELLGVL